MASVKSCPLTFLKLLRAGFSTGIGVRLNHSFTSWACVPNAMARKQANNFFFIPKDYNSFWVLQKTNNLRRRYFFLIEKKVNNMLNPRNL